MVAGVHGTWPQPMRMEQLIRFLEWTWLVPAQTYVKEPICRAGPGSPDVGKVRLGTAKAVLRFTEHSPVDGFLHAAQSTFILQLCQSRSDLDLSRLLLFMLSQTLILFGSQASRYSSRSSKVCQG